MGPIRSLQLAVFWYYWSRPDLCVCVCVSVCFSLCRWIVCRYCMRRDNWKNKTKERPGNPLFLFWCSTLLHSGWHDLWKWLLGALSPEALFKKKKSLVFSGDQIWYQTVVARFLVLFLLYFTEYLSPCCRAKQSSIKWVQCRGSWVDIVCLDQLCS